MAAVTVHTDFEAQENQICYCFHFFPFYLPWSDETRCHDLFFWVLSFKPVFLLSSFTLLKRLFSFSSLSAVSTVSSANLNMSAGLESSAVATRLQKVSFHSNLKEGLCQTMLSYCTSVLISHVSKVMLKILQARLQQCMNWELPDVQAGFRKGGRTRNQIANIHWIVEKVKEFQKNIYFCFIDYAKAFVQITTNCGKFLKR